MSAVTVRIPRLLAELSSGQRTVEVEAHSIEDALDALGTAHPELRIHLFDEHGGFRPHVNLFHNGVIVRWPECARTPLADGDEVGVVQAVSGGG